MQRIILKTIALLCCSAPALADPIDGQTTHNPDNPTINADKSDYTLFDPTPDDELRKFVDRPDKSKSPYTLDAGHFSYKSELLTWTYDHNNVSGHTISNFAVAQTSFKAGLTNDIDADIVFTPVDVYSDVSHKTKINNSGSATGNFEARVKYNVLGNDGGDYALGISPYYQTQTSTIPFARSQWISGADIPFSVALPGNWIALVQTEFDAQENFKQNGSHVAFQNLIDFTHPIVDNVRGYIEFTSNVNTDPVLSTNQYSMELSTVWQPRKNLKINFGTSIGLNKAAPDFAPYIGLAQRF